MKTDDIRGYARRGAGFLLLSIGACALILRIYGLGAHSLWFDEAILAGARLDFFQWFPRYLLNVGEIFYPILLYSTSVVFYWQGLAGNAEFALRFSSVIFGLLSIAALYLFAKEAFGACTALLAAFLLSISPWHVHYSRELSVYAALCFFSLLCAYAAMKIKNTGKGVYWIVYAASAVTAIYFHYAAFLITLVLAPWLFSVIEKDSRRKRLFWGSHGLIIVCVIPCFVNAFAILKYMMFSTTSLNRGDFPFWAGRLNAASVFFTLKNMSIGYNTSLFEPAGFAATLISAAFFAYGVSGFRREANRLLLLLCVAVPPLCLLLLSLASLCYVDRYFFPSLPFFVTGIACGVSRTGKRAPLAACLLAALACAGLANYYANRLPVPLRERIAVQKRRDIDIREAVRLISGSLAPDDAFLQTSKATVYPFKFYAARDSAGPFFTEKAGRGTVAYYDETAQKLMSADFSFPSPSVARNIGEARVSPAGRTWLVFSSWQPVGDLPDVRAAEEYKIVEMLSSRFSHKETMNFRDFIVYLFYN